jgi:YfiH family protein
MIVKSVNDLTIYQFESFDESIVGHGFVSRKGGVSPAPWESLNQGGGLGDSRENVIENRKRAFESIGRRVESLYDVWQVHSADIVVTDSPRPLDADHVKADAIITSNPEVTVFMRFADCVPILMYDPQKKIIATVHAGWQGTVKKIVERTVCYLDEKFAVDPASIVAGIGPSIGPCHYQVGEDVVTSVKREYPGDYQSLIHEKQNALYLDLWKTNELQLRNKGVKCIEVAEICTACDTDAWFSHRVEHGRTGRFAAALFLKA